MDTNAIDCDEIKAKFTDICTPIINQMSEKLVTNLNDVLKASNTTFKVKKFEDKFKKDMNEKWHDEFSTIWNTHELHQRLAELDEKKRKQKQQQQQQSAQENDSIKNPWRAHGHTPEQQTQLCRYRKMTVHLMHMRELLGNQSEELKKLIYEVECRRTYFNDASKRRSKIVTEIDANLEKLQIRLNNTEQ